MEAFVAAILVMIGLIAGAAVAWLLRGRDIVHMQGSYTALSDALQHEKAARTAAENRAVFEADAQKEKLAETARLSERVGILDSQLARMTKDNQEAERRRIDLEAAKKLADEDLARLNERLGQFTNLEVRLRNEFENIANRILLNSSASLSENSQRELNTTLAPLRERLQDFQNKIETAYESEKRDVLSLKEQIGLLVQTSNTVGGQADSLAKALRGESQVLGRWGEITLERILERAGLTEGREYISQGRGLGLRNENGGLQKPDIIVLFPENRAMIIDSKVPLTGYERLNAAANEEERASLGRQFVRDVRVHIDGLAGKQYQDNEKLIAHECVLMFVPIEGALAAALGADGELFSYAWKRRVVLVSPSILLLSMQTVHSIWRYELQERNAQEIARLAGELLDKVSMSLGDLNAAREKISAAIGAHDEAVKRLSTGKGNALSIGERIKILGVKTKRPTPAILIEGGLIAAAVDEAPDPITQFSQETEAFAAD